MNMSYSKGQFVGYVPVADDIAVPLPQRWYILRVQPNRESRLMRLFRQRCRSAYLPLTREQIEIRRIHAGREWIERREVMVPLITGCVLVPDFEVKGIQGAPNGWRSFDGAIGLLKFGEFTPYLTPKLMDDIRRIEAISNTPKSKRERAFKEGQLVRVVSGPFRGFCGQVERVDSKTRLSVGINIFGRITPAILEQGEIEAV